MWKLLSFGFLFVIFIGTSNAQNQEKLGITPMVNFELFAHEIMKAAQPAIIKEQAEADAKILREQGFVPPVESVLSGRGRMVGSDSLGLRILVHPRLPSIELTVNDERFFFIFGSQGGRPLLQFSGGVELKAFEDQQTVENQRVKVFFRGETVEEGRETFYSNEHHENIRKELNARALFFSGFEDDFRKIIQDW